MAYTKTNWRTDDTITAALLNKMEQGIEDANNSGGGSGADGFSPVVTITDITGGHRVSIRDKTSTKTFDVMDGAAGATGPKGDTGTTGSAGADGFSPTVTVTNITGGHRVAITDKSGTKTFDVMNGSGSGGSSVAIDTTLTIEGAAADAKRLETGLMHFSRKKQQITYTTKMLP